MDTNVPNPGYQETEAAPEPAPFEIGDAVAILKRRIWHIIIPFVLLSPIAFAVAVLLPPVWRSEAIVLIEQPDVPPDLVSSTVTSFADQRVQIIKQKVTATDVLVGIMDKFGLYRADPADQRRRPGDAGRDPGGIHQRQRHGPAGRPAQEGHDRVQHRLRIRKSAVGATGRQRVRLLVSE
jgi:uncharacterized protein involved in exopolysaccharide biosynthesis